MAGHPACPYLQAQTDTKIHLLADNFGRPVRVAAASKKSPDPPPARDMIHHQQGRHVLAGRTYDAGYFRDAGTTIGQGLIMPSQSMRKHQAAYDRQHDHVHNQIRRLAGSLKHFRRIAP